MSKLNFVEADFADFSCLLDSENYHSTQDRHADFDIRAESLNQVDTTHPDEIGSDFSGISGIKLDIIESTLTTGSKVRLTGIVSGASCSNFTFGQYRCGYEILVLDGEILATSGGRQHKATSGQYLRIPYGEQARFSNTGRFRFLIKLGEMSDTDHESRLISTDDKELWLPGPTDGTEVLPLHLHDTKNVLLIRWNTPAYFKPQLDPLGEELFVVSGTLHDAYGSYEKNSWIRNPIPAWQSWGGHADTVVYYKNGHFPVI